MMMRGKGCILQDAKFAIKAGTGKQKGLACRHLSS